ncbi:MAG: gluconate 2-dehydrogenase subunit 3 family protein [Deltaproteobacteria bacterium]|nr:gluconate 2-dehydrogenase subunit 3 family protein [Deltaproteobacteria bacterium]
MSESRIDRRDFVRGLALLAGASAIPLPLSGCTRRTSRQARGGRSLRSHEWAAIEAAASRIIPTDDLPGAREANVVGFIDAQLAEPDFAVFRREVRRGALALDALAKRRHGSSFDAASPAEQDEVLAAIQGGEGSDGRFRSAHFFRVLFTLTIEGLLCDPVHGGNAGEVGWKIIGYVPSQPRPVWARGSGRAQLTGTRVRSRA